VYGSDGGSWLVTGLRLEGTLYFSAKVGGGDVVVLFSYTNLHCTCENMLFWKRVDQLWPRPIGWQGSRSALLIRMDRRRMILLFAIV
jgi:hypothetical protein